MSILYALRRLASCLILPSLGLLSGCAYRFSNTAMKAPLGVQTIAVQSIYDESREVVPHELLWSALQRAIVRNGRVTLTNQEEADALMVLSITKAKINPAGTPSQETLSRDLPESETIKGNPDQYRNLRRAGTWTTDEGITLVVHVNVFDLKSRALLFNKDYSQAVTFKSFRGISITPTESAYLQYDEALQGKFKAISENLANTIVSDFLM